MIAQMVHDIDDKHDEGHARLRKAVDKMWAKIEALEQTQTDNLLKFERLTATKERRHELSTNRTVIIAAAIGGGFRLLEVILTSVAGFLQHVFKP